jgi:4-amino-4-deoxy-L-arabinose transferase-like glycosyltransferase
MTAAITEDRLKRWDYVLLGLISLAFFSHTLFIGRVFTLHESILPQTSREMLADHDWMIPKNGGRPWLEKPPLPQWITVAVLRVTGCVESEWPYRLAPIFCGTGTILLAAWLASTYFGRRIGWLSGLILATCWDFLRYATYAEADIFLCLIVAAAVVAFARSATASGRRCAFWLFFALLGLTNLAKGLLFGAAMALIPIFGWLIWNRDWHGLRRLLSLRGWLLTVLIAAIWPVCAYLRYPDALNLWIDDHWQRLGNGFIGNPPWYYATTLLWILLPWTAFVLAGLWITRKQAWRNASPGYRFIWCWATLPPLCFSIPDGKHHHYLLHCLPAWAMLGAHGVLFTWQWIAGWPGWLKRPEMGLAAFGTPAMVALLLLRDHLAEPAWLLPALLLALPLAILLVRQSLLEHRPAYAVGVGFGVVMAVYVVALTYRAQFADQRRPDSDFFTRVEPLLEPNKAVLVDAEQEGLEVLRAQFYLGERARVLHNLTFLLDERLKESELYLLSRTRREEELARYGTAERLMQSERARRETSPLDRWSLYRLRLREDLPKKPLTELPSVMQTADRHSGPYLDR